jgi:hypothetical protein
MPGLRVHHHVRIVHSGHGRLRLVRVPVRVHRRLRHRRQRRSRLRALVLDGMRGPNTLPLVLDYANADGGSYGNAHGHVHRQRDWHRVSNADQIRLRHAECQRHWHRGVDGDGLCHQFRQQHELAQRDSEQYKLGQRDPERHCIRDPVWQPLDECDGHCLGKRHTVRYSDVDGDIVAD